MLASEFFWTHITMQFVFSSQFAIGGAIDPLLAVWMPNIVFAVIGGLLYYLAPK